jgi:hypothetical protein
MAITFARYPVAPTITPPLGTLLDAATVSDEFAWNEGNDLFESYNCLQFGAEAVFCAPNTITLAEGIGWQDGIKFAAYGGIRCKAVGMDIEQAKAEVRAAFETGESTAVERALMSDRFIADTVPLGSRWAAPTDITPAAGAVKPGVGIALLEGHASSQYVGMPTLHIPRVIASLVLGVDGAEFSGSVLQTKLGSKVAAGAGYDFPNTGPTGAAAPTGEKWLYATGEVAVQRGDVILQDTFNQSNNEVVILAERPYVASVDCYAAAVRVQVTS